MGVCRGNSPHLELANILSIRNLSICDYLSCPVQKIFQTTYEIVLPLENHLAHPYTFFAPGKFSADAHAQHYYCTSKRRCYLYLNPTPLKCNKSRKWHEFAAFDDLSFEVSYRVDHRINKATFAKEIITCIPIPLTSYIP